MYEKSLLASVVLAFGLSTAANADILQFDPSGSGGQTGGLSTDELDWSTGNALAQGVITSQGLQPGNVFTLYSQATLSTFNLNSAQAPDQGGLNTSFEITYVLAVSLQVDSVTTSPTTGNQIAQFSLSDQQLNFFEIYISAINSDALTGSGFNDGALLFQGNIDVAEGVNSNFISFANAGLSALDGFGNNDYPGILSASGTGSTFFNVSTTFVNQNYFFDAPALNSSFQLALDFSTSQVTPFNGQNPSECFTGAPNPDPMRISSGVQQCDTAFQQGLLTGSGGALITMGGVNAHTGSINGLTGPDFIFQVDASNSFISQQRIPAPATLTLLGLGLGFLGLSRRYSGIQPTQQPA